MNKTKFITFGVTVAGILAGTIIRNIFVEK